MTRNVASQLVISPVSHLDLRRMCENVDKYTIHGSYGMVFINPGIISHHPTPPGHQVESHGEPTDLLDLS